MRTPEKVDRAVETVRLDRRVPRVVAHRGASAEAPENTLAAVRRAVARDADLVEIDVQRTKDGALVVMHDTTLARTTDVRRVFPDRQPWLVKDFTADEIARLDAGGWWSRLHAGERVPTLEEVIDVLRPTRTGLLLEVKAPALHPGLVADVVSTLEAVPGYVEESVAASRLVVQSFDHAAVRRHKRLLPAVPVAALGAPSPSELAGLASWADQVNPALRAAGRGFVASVHRHRLECSVWTVDRPVQVRRALGLGVDGIITNDPARVRRIVDAWAVRARAGR